MADFGIARALGRRDEHLTETGTGDRHPGVHEPGAGRGRARPRRADRHLLARLRAVRDAGGRAAVHRPDGAGDHRARFTSRSPSVRAVRGRRCRRRSSGRSRRRWRGSAGGPVRLGGASWRGRFEPTVTGWRRPSAALRDRRHVRRRGRAPGATGVGRLLGLGFLLGLGVLFALAPPPREAPGGGAGPKRAGGAPVRQPRRARTTSTSPTGSPTRSGASWRRSRACRSPPAGAQPVQEERGRTERDRAGAGRGLPPGGQGAMGEGRRAAEPGAGEPELIQVSTGSAPVGAAVRRRADRRVPGAGGRRGAGGAGARRGAGRRARTGARGAADAEPGGVRRLLKGEEVSRSLDVGDPPTLRRAMVYYEQAVALDSNFVAAWAQRARAYAVLYANGIPGRPSRKRRSSRPTGHGRSGPSGPRAILRSPSITATSPPTAPARSSRRSSASRSRRPT